MAITESYTPLERFLFVETLHPFDAETLSFEHASNSLRSHDVFQDGRSQRQDLLEPGSLQDLYIGLIREEMKLGQGKVDAGAVANEPQSPQLRNITDAAKYRNLLPQLLDRLYFAYRDHAIKSIENEERNAKQLRREIDETQRAEREATSRKSSIQTLLRHDPVEERPSSKDSGQNLKSPPQHNGELRPGSKEGYAQPTVATGQPLPSATVLPSSAADVPPVDVRPTSQPDVSESSPFSPPSQQTAGFVMASPKSEASRRLPLTSNPSRPNLGPPPSPHLAQAPSERSSASPIILPPPPGMRHPGSPQGPLDALADMAGQQYRVRPPLPSPRSSQGVHPAQYSPQSYPQHPYSYYDGRPHYSGPYQGYTQAPASHYSSHAGYSPYQAPTQPPGPVQQYAGVPPYHPLVPQHPQYSTYGHPPQYHPHTPRQGPFSVPSYPASAQQIPQTTASGKPRPPRPSPIVTPASATKWKGLDPGSVRTIGSPKRPGPDEISPISDRAPSLPPDKSSTQEQTTKTKTRSKSSKRTGTKSQPRRDSTTSNTRTRSQSLASLNEAIKPEPATPAASETPSLLSTTVDETRRSTRRRRDTMRGREMAEETSRTAPKRKRTSTHGSPAPSASVSSTPSPFMQGKVLGTRNFPRTSATIMNDITSHKLAGMFARPLTEREAPGYKNLIYRATDLKSIKSAIAGGARALGNVENVEGGVTATSVLVEKSQEIVPPKGIVNSAQLEKELMRMFANAVMFNPDPKRGIPKMLRKKRIENHIPAGQSVVDVELENAEEEVESGEEEGMVKDTREMFEAVEGTVEQWRQAERAAEELDSGGVKGERARFRVGEEGEETLGEDTMDEEGGKKRDMTPTAMGKRRRKA